MITQIVIVKKDCHANLDSFPFRYGFSEIEADFVVGLTGMPLGDFGVQNENYRSY